MEWEKRFNAPRLVRPAGAVLVKLEAMSKNRRASVRRQLMRWREMLKTFSDKIESEKSVYVIRRS